MNKQNERLAQKLGEILLGQHATVCSAESITGGMLASTFTDNCGSGQYFEAAFVVYNCDQKKRLLGVPADLLDNHGAVSAACVEAMVNGACARTQCEYGVAISGEAGPIPQESDVGTVWFAWKRGKDVYSAHCHFPGDRRQVREAAVAQALTGLINIAQGSRPAACE